MSKFAIQQSGKRVPTADIAIEGLEGMRPILTCKPANEDNPAYFNAVLRRQRNRRGRQTLELKDIRKFRRDDVDLLTEHCVIGWDKAPPVDGEGNPVEFSKDECSDFLGALLNGARDVFDDFRDEVSATSTFVEYSDPDEIADQAGN